MTIKNKVNKDFVIQDNEFQFINFIFHEIIFQIIIQLNFIFKTLSLSTNSIQYLQVFIQKKNIALIIIMYIYYQTLINFIKKNRHRNVNL